MVTLFSTPSGACEPWHVTPCTPSQGMGSRVDPSLNQHTCLPADGQGLVSVTTAVLQGSMMPRAINLEPLSCETVMKSFWHWLRAVDSRTYLEEVDEHEVRHGPRRRVDQSLHNRHAHEEASQPSRAICTCGYLHDASLECA